MEKILLVWISSSLMGHLTCMQTSSTYPKVLTFSVETRWLNHYVHKTPHLIKKFTAMSKAALAGKNYHSPLGNSFGSFPEIAPTLSKYDLLQTILKQPDSGVLKPCSWSQCLFFDKTLGSLHCDFLKPNVCK